MSYNFRLYFKLLYWSLFKTKGTHARLTPKRIKSLFFWFFIIPIHNLLTWIGFGLDEIFFRGYRTQEIEAPVFIIGNFRSRFNPFAAPAGEGRGTSHCHDDPGDLHRPLDHPAGLLEGSRQGGSACSSAGCSTSSSPAWKPRTSTASPCTASPCMDVDEDEGILCHNWTSSFLMFPFPFMDLLAPYLHFDDEMIRQGEAPGDGLLLRRWFRSMSITTAGGATLPRTRRSAPRCTPCGSISRMPSSSIWCATRSICSPPRPAFSPLSGIISITRWNLIPSRTCSSISLTAGMWIRSHPWRSCPTASTWS